MTEKWFKGDDDISVCRKIREEVFIKEQKGSPEEEFDGLDCTATHLAVIDDSGKAVACCRLIRLGDELYKIGRIAVLKPYRKMHIGKTMVEAMLKKAKELGAKQVKVGAQLHAVGFYEKLGFATIGSEYIEANIPHIDMLKNL